MKNILIGGAWPYANGSLHIGHIAALLPADVLARYHRAAGDKVCFVSGSDCHGTPVAIRAKQEGKTPEEISDLYHEEFSQCFRKLGFSYDLYTKTSSPAHKDFVSKFHKKLYESPYVYEKEVPQAYCECCHAFLADRFVEGLCPVCGKSARGDQCDECGAVLEAENLQQPVCAVCGSAVSFRSSRHLFIAITRLKDRLQELVDTHENWRKNAAAFSRRYLGEGLRDRALTRDLEWGIDVPKAGYEGKKIYIWAENVLGYLSTSHEALKGCPGEFERLWGLDGGCGSEAGEETEAPETGAAGENAEIRHYYVHGKDNIPFHTIILPSLLIANGSGWHLPDEIISSEYLTLEGRKISTSRNYAIWIKDMIDKYDADSLRYYLLANGPEKKDADFSWREFVNSHNGELLGAYGNFVNRTLVFIRKYLDGTVPCGTPDTALEEELKKLFADTGARIEKGRFKDAVDGIFELVRKANKYFDSTQPWITRNTDAGKCADTLYNCVQLIAGLAVLLYPFLPFSSEKICGWLQLSTEWKPQQVKAGYPVPEVQVLFERLDKKVVEEETEKLEKLLPEN